MSPTAEHGNGKRVTPNKALQQTGHANEACARHNANFRVSRLLSFVFGEGGAARVGFDVDAFVPDGRCVTMDPALSAAFAAAAEWVRAKTGCVDGFLQFGSLDCHQAIGFIERGLARPVGPAAEASDIWTPEEVRSMAEAARWPDLETVPPEERWAYWSARRFVETCVAQELGIWFS